MASVVPADWTVTRADGNIRYIGDDHGDASPSYVEVINLHRWLQGLADDAVASGDDELDITNQNPSARSTDNIITLLGSYNIDATAAEHLFDGSIIQTDGAEIYEGIVNFGNADVQIQIHQDGAVVVDDWWNYDGGGLNADAANGISHRFMIQVRTGDADVDGRRILGTCRRFGYTYSEFNINGTSRGNNVLALSDANDLNNENDASTVGGWTTIDNTTEGYIAIDVNNDGTDEYFYSEWNREAHGINDFYERMKWLTMEGSVSTLYGLNGELFRGITHEVDYTGLTGTFDEANEISWTGASAGTGQVLADDGAGTVWIQLLTGVAPVATASLSQSVPDAASATTSTVTDRSSLVATPFIGASTGSAIIGAYGVGIEYADLTSADTLFDLTNTVKNPPNNVINTVGGLVSGEDRVLVAPWDGTTVDDEDNPAIDKGQLLLSTALTIDPVIEVVVKAGTEAAIPADTPSTGYIRVTDNDGFERRLHYTAWDDTGNTFTIDTSDGNEDFSVVNAAVDSEIYIAYLDELATGVTSTYTGVYASDRDLMVLVRDGDSTPIKEFISGWSFTGSPQTITAIRTTDE